MRALDPVLVSGAAGFIGMHVARRLLREGNTVVGLDNLNDYYDPKLKDARLSTLTRFPNFAFKKADLADRAIIAKLFDNYRFSTVVHLAAQPGARHSLRDPHSYADANLTGFLNILEGCRQTGCRNLIFASSASVYGADTRMPLSEAVSVNHPLSLYGATKKANELMAHAYAHLFAIPITGLRFFTVYGPWGRPDMAIWLFATAIMEGTPIRLFNNGRMRRDFTYIDDVTEAIARLVAMPAASDPGWSGDSPNPAASNAPWRIYNVGNSQPIGLMDLVSVIEKAVGRLAIRELLPMQPGDVVETCADSTDLERAVGFRPNTPIQEGVRRFVEWLNQYRAGRATVTR